MDKDRIKVIRGFIFLGTILLATVMYVTEIIEIIRKIYGIVSPVLFGLLVAFILNAPITQFESLYSKIHIKNHRMKEGVVKTLSFITTFIILGAIVGLASILIFPNLISSISSLIDKIKENWPTWIDWLEKNGFNTEHIQENFTNIDLSQFTSRDGIVAWVLKTVSSTFVGIITFLVSFVIALYALIDRKKLGKIGNKTVKALFPSKAAEKIIDCGQRLQKSYSNFFSAQCLESCILGSLMFLTLTIFKIPYAGLIAVLTAIFAFVPYIGAWLACGVGCILMIVTAPSKILACIIVYTITQMVENNFIYPYVVGNKVELSPLVTLSSVVIGGSMFGLFGMVMFIPLMVVIRDLFNEYVDKKYKEKEKINKRNHTPPKSQS